MTDSKLTRVPVRKYLRSSRPATGERLSNRDIDVLLLLCQGLQQKEIAHELGISKRTVECYQQQLREKLGAANAVQLGYIAATYPELSQRPQVKRNWHFQTPFHEGGTEVP